MNELVLEIVKLVVMLVVTGVCAYAVPYLKSKIGMDKLDKLAFWSNQFVLTAQQVMWAKTGEERKAYVKDAMKEITREANIKITDEQMDALIEASVKAMKMNDESGTAR